MKLIKLSSSNPRFRTLNFKPGLNIVLGKKVSKDDTDTYNSVGKSLALELIHFMLGHNFNKCITKNLSDYEFVLNFRHLEKDYEIIRQPSRKYIVCNNERMPDSDLSDYIFRELILPRSHELPEKGISSFRSLFNRFARLKKAAYTEAINQVGKENGFQNNLYNAFLLGLETAFILEKQEIKNKKSRSTSLKTKLKSFRAVDQSEILDIEDEIKEIENVLNNFKIAENYSELVKKADQLTGKIDALSNKIFINNKRIENKKKSLKETPDIPVSVIKKLWEETDYFFNEKVERELDKVEAFHTTLITNRKSRFLREIQELEIENGKLSSERSLLDNERAEIMKITKNSGAWDEYESLRNRLESLRRKKDELLKYEDLYKELQKEEAELKAKFAENNNYAVTYLASKEQDIKRIKEIFREIARNFYHKHPGNIDIDINQNSNANKIYDIRPHIDEDSGDGINEVKIFCYDLLLYRLNLNLFGFMAHDSRLFSDMDERQRARALLTAHDEYQRNGLQYFCSLNEDNFKTSLEVLKDDEQEILTHSVILELTDESEDKKLFGFKFNC